MTFKLIDLFSGAGGLSLGFLDKRFGGGFDSILAIDNDQAACKTYNDNFGHHCITENIEEWVSNNLIPKADIVIGGPPCQGFSTLNKNRDGDVRRALWEPYMDIVERSNASMFIMENVQGLLKSEEFLDIQDRAKKLGFNLAYQVLNTADYGVAQQRKRAIVVAWKAREFEFELLPYFPPKPTHIDPKLVDNRRGCTKYDLANWLTVEHVIGDLPAPVGTEIRDIEEPLDLHFGRNPTKLSMDRYRVVPPGGNRFDLQRNAPELTPPCWIKKKSGGTDLFGRLWWNRPSVTIRTEFFKPEKGRYLHPEQHRPITHREAARIMSFPDDFKFSGSKIDIAKQIGNAVPPVFAGKIAKYVKELLTYRLSNSELDIHEQDDLTISV